MPNYYSPGVYIEEVNKGPRPIEAVATSVAAFVGFAPYSVVRNRNRPVLITSWTQYVEAFGRRDPESGRKEPYLIADNDGALHQSYLSHAVFGFFQNGGSRCYVVNVTPPFDPPPVKVLAIPDADSRRKRTEPTTILNISPHKDLKLDDEIEIRIERTAGSQPDERLVTFTFVQGEEREQFPGIHFPDAPPPSPSSGPSPAGGSRRKEKEKVEPDPASGSGAAGGGPPPEDPAATSTPPAFGGGSPLGDPPKDTIDYINKHSKLVQIKLENEKLGLLPAFDTYYLEVPQPGANALMTVGETALVGDASARSGVAGLEIADDVTIVCCPDLMSPLIYKDKDEISETRVRAVQTAMISHCELAGGRIAVLDAPQGMSPQEIERWRVHIARYDSMFAALYYPWITIANPNADRPGQPRKLTIPPCGHIAGIYARNDTERGVHKAPANEVVRGALEPVREISRGEQDGLNPNGINCIRAFPGRGIRVWGARTLSSDPAWRYVNVRRLFNMVEKSIERDTQWVVFEPNDPGLWSRVRRDVNAFLMTLWRDGALFGATPQEAFYVKCDAELNPPESRDLGRLIIEVGLAPVKPAEFVIFRFSQYAAGGA